MAQLYYSPISINAAQVPSTQTDFPVLVSQTDARFKTIGNGGHVNNSSGFDIRPYSDTGLTTALTYQLERYNASTGEVIMWVKVSSLSSSTTPIYLGYGDTGISTDGSSTSTWDSNFVNVYHLKDGTTLDTTSNNGGNNLTNHSATAATGKIDGGAGLVSASSQYLDETASSATVAMTFSIWVNATSFPNAYNATIFRNPDNTRVWGILIKSTGKLACWIMASTLLSYDGTGSNTLSTSTWYYLTLTYNSSAGLKAYVNGSVDQSVAANGNGNTTVSGISLGKDPTNGRYWNGAIDEARISNIARSADWITTEYNNQSAPGTFETLGSEVSLSGSTSNFFLLFP